MQFVRVTSAAALFVLCGMVIPAYAQHDRQHQDKEQGKAEKRQGKQPHSPAASAQQQHPQGRAQQTQAHGQQRQNQAQEQHGQPTQLPQRAQPSQRQEAPQQQRVQATHRQQPQQAQRSPQVRQQQQPYRPRQQAVAWQQQRGWLQQGGWQGNGSWQQGRAQQWESEHRTWAQRGGYGGYYIPQDRFSLYFGNRHWFRINNRSTIYMGYPRFSYGGYSFLLVDPWPEYWAESWYDSDDVYVDYDDGYYLHNRTYPSVRLAITVAL